MKEENNGMGIILNGEFYNGVVEVRRVINHLMFAKVVERAWYSTLSVSMGLR